MNVKYAGAIVKVDKLGNSRLKMTVTELRDHNVSKIGWDVLDHDDKLLSQDCMDH